MPLLMYDKYGDVTVFMYASYRVNNTGVKLGIWIVQRSGSNTGLVYPKS